MANDSLAVPAKNLTADRYGKGAAQAFVAAICAGLRGEAFERIDLVEQWITALRNKTFPPHVRADLLKYITDRRYGRPTEHHEVEQRSITIVIGGKMPGEVFEWAAKPARKLEDK